MRQGPAYCIHKIRNLAFIRFGGRLIYLGRAHSLESHERYHEVLAAHYAEKPPTAATPRRKPTVFTVAELGPGGHCLNLVEPEGPRNLTVVVGEPIACHMSTHGGWQKGPSGGNLIWKTRTKDSVIRARFAAG